MMDLGRVCTVGMSFRARAEARQREYRANVLGAGCSKWGHWLDDAAVLAGRNFVIPGAHETARARERAGKGVAARTFQNMLASQAMCFNIFRPLARDSELAAAILEPMIPGLARVRSIQFEYTPAAEVFDDQSGLAGVDCDLLIEADWSDGERAVVAVETKFVEPEFSVCGFRKPGRAKRPGDSCPEDVAVRDDPSKCLYSSRKQCMYWERTYELGNIDRKRLPEAGCPFGGALWQLWANHTLAHVEAARRAPRPVRSLRAGGERSALARGSRAR